MNYHLERVKSSREFSINRRRNLKSKISKNLKSITIKYTELSSSQNTKIKKNVSSYARTEIIQPKRIKEETKLSNEIIVFDNKKIVNTFVSMISKSNVWEKHDFSIAISSKNHMSIDLKSNWADRIKFNKIYLLNSNERVIMNDTFDNLHVKEKMKWFTKSTLFDYSIFVTYRTIMKNDKLTRKDRAVVDIKDLNAITVSDAYSMSAQTNITTTIAECQYISVVNVLRYFYQWIVKFDDRHKFTIISHRDQKQFNVCVMSYKNSSIYVQRQIDLMLKNLRSFVRVYMNDIIIFFKTLKDHFAHLRLVFERLWHYNVALNLRKIFLEYSSIVLLEQIVDVLDLITIDEKLTAIANLTFSFTLKKLKTYLKLTKYLRVYVAWYAQTSSSLQKRKTLLLKQTFTKEKSRKLFAKKISLNQSTKVENLTYEHLQHVFSDKKFLRHYSNIRKLFIDVDISKKRDVEAMIFHVKNDSDERVIFKRCDIKSIMFLSKILISAKIRYWLTKLEMTDVIWVIRKVRHLIKTSRKSSMIIFTNHSILISIIKQIILNTINIDKLNLRLVRISQYLFALSIDIKVKLEKFHIISNALFRLFFVMNKNKSIKKDDVLENLQYDFENLLVQSISEIKTSSFDIKSTRINDYLDTYFD
jgi:hypothetical protein